MHLANGAITPECAAITWTAAAGGLALCSRAAQKAGVTREKVQLAAALGCFTFAAQAINVPLAPDFSGHLVGGVLLAWFLGPGLGALTMALVLLLQAVTLGDGGLASLGANIINMAILPAASVAFLKQQAHLRESNINAAIASGLSVILAAALIVGETALFRPTADLSGWPAFAAQMLAAHVWIGLFEAAISLAVLSLVASFSRRYALRPALLGIATLALLAAMFLPLSSSLPDGYEAAAEASGLSWLLK
jgi:cobalt/nickel transport system permease protein